ncbi:acetyl-CoA carboxylase carboxyltransferase subunit alpha [Acidobacteriota bacterium]
MKDMLEFEQPIVDLQEKIKGLKLVSSETLDLTPQIEELEQKLSELEKEIYGNLTPWQRTLIARHPSRPHSSDYIDKLFSNFIELHGDRSYRDDPSIICGLGTIDNFSVAVIAQEKGKDTEDNIYRNFGMPHPEGYRKSLRIMELAEKFKLPIVTLVDTPGAYPGIEAESRGQATAIAENLMTMSTLRVPIISTVIGEGGSGGALGIAVSDRVLMLENSIYSVISPEGCASILYSDAGRMKDSAESLRVNAQNHLEFKLIDEIIPEPLGGMHKNPEKSIPSVGKVIVENLTELEKLEVDTLLEQRYAKYRSMGLFKED